MRAILLAGLLAPLLLGCGDDDDANNQNQNQNQNNNTVDPVCGDGTVNGSESCDDGAANSDTAPDACRSDCREAHCGDGVTDTNEVCDDDNTTSGDGCTADCQSDETCGNGTVDSHVGEACDDSNTAGADGCSETCQVEACGNGTLDTGEQCDDDNLASHDACSSGCTTEIYDWRSLAFGTEPTARGGAAMVYDSARDVIVLFGGDGPNTVPTDYSQETWEYDGTSWTKRTLPGPLPDARAGALLAFDESRGVVVLYGGENTGHPRMGDTWEYDGTGWSNRTASLSYSPPARIGAAMTYDASADQVFLFGGVDTVVGYSNQAFAYDGSGWVEVTPGTSPSARRDAAITFDRQRGVVVMFGGRIATSTYEDDTWEYHNGAWQNVSPTASPDSRGTHSLVYDPWLQRTVLFGGYCGDFASCFLGDTWTWDGSAWSLQNTNNAPSPRWSSASAFVPQRRGVLLFGGIGRSGAQASYSDETWLLRFDVTPTPYPDEDCTNGTDEDADSLVDCADPDCEGLLCATGRCLGGVCN